MRRLFRLSLNLILVLLLVIIIGQFVLLPAAGRAVQTVLQETFPGADVQIDRIAAFPAVKLLAGVADGVDLKIANLEINGINVSSLELNAVNLSWDFRQLWRGFTDFPDAKNFRMVAVLTAGDLNRYLGKWVINGLDQPNLIFQSGQAILEGNVRLLGRNLPVEVSGNFAVDQGLIWFKPQKVSLRGQQLGVGFSEELSKGMSFKLPVELPQGIETEKLILTEQGLEIYLHNQGT